MVSTSLVEQKKKRKKRGSRPCWNCGGDGSGWMRVEVVVDRGRVKMGGGGGGDTRGGGGDV